MAPSKLVVVSTRLPVALERGEDGWSASAAPGGLATALRAVARDRDFTWVGWPGAEVPPEEQDRLRAVLWERTGTRPVFLDGEEYEGFYGTISNRFLWPNFHMMATPRRFDHAAWERYREVNRRFADEVLRVVQPGDSVWVHDYQLCLVPRMLREAGLDLQIGFFLHIPFPSSEVFRTLPVREELLLGMLGADLVGFHVYEYVSHFRTSALRVLGAESDPEVLRLEGHKARLGVFPIGIDAEGFAELARSEEVAGEVALARQRYRGRKVVLGVDRMDYTKGLPEKLLAFRDLLERRPDLRDRAVLVQIASPSRTGVQEYQDLKREIDELVGDVNGRLGSLEHQPVVYVNQQVDQRHLAALYQVADVMLVTPVRDGMNLVCLEYVAARETPGTLILSEFTGAAHCLGGAVLVNPHNQVAVSEALERALDAEEPDAAGFAHLQRFTLSNTSQAWARRFLRTLERSPQELAPARRRLTAERVAELPVPAQPLVLLDYDGTLAPHVAVPSRARPSKRALEALGRLAAVARVYVVSGRPRDVLERWLGELPIGLSCEHGLQERPPGEGWTAPPPIDPTPLGNIAAALQDATERTPGSHVEEKQASLAWHYRRADPKLGAWRAKELRGHLDELLSDTMFTVLAGSKVVEVRHVHVTKGEAVTRALERHPETDFVLCCGNDRTDEDMFEVLEAGEVTALCCRVGADAATFADHFVRDVPEMLGVIEALGSRWERS